MICKRHFDADGNEISDLTIPATGEKPSEKPDEKPEEKRREARADGRAERGRNCRRCGLGFGGGCFGGVCDSVVCDRKEVVCRSRGGDKADFQKIDRLRLTKI
ncbi:MAG: hypothetical protein ACLUSP_11745 [Christensenellales bacterium]